MKIPSAIYGALGGAVVASVVWIAATPTAKHEPAAGETADPDRRGASRVAPRPISSLDSAGPATTAGGSQTWSEEARAEQKAIHARASRPIPAHAAAERELTRAELYVRATQVEEQANAQLESLAQRLNLTEEQQDRIFPLLASASPAFHPSLRPEGATNNPTTTTAGGSANSTAAPIYGDGNSLSPGAPIAEVENAIYPELDEVQQASLEEVALDREAWWEDVVAMLEDDLESSTSTATTAADDGAGNQSRPEVEVSEEERQAAGQTEQIGGFSNLFGN